MVKELFEEARKLAPLDFEARYSNPQLKIEPKWVWERDGTFYIVLEGCSPDERWLEFMRVIPYPKENGAGYFLKVDKVVEVC